MPIPERLDDTVVLVTGASSGLGRAIALAAGERGATVALLARRRERLTELAETIGRAGGGALPIPADIRRADEVRFAFRSLDERSARLDLVVSCAGVLTPVGPLIDTDPERVRESLETNVLGVYLTMRAALRRMRDQPGGGTLINMTSGAAANPYAGGSAYCSSKAAVDMLTRCAAFEEQETGVRIMALNPGPFESPMQELIRGTDAEHFPARERFQRLHDEGRLPGTEEVAEIVLALGLSDWPELSGAIVDLRSTEFRTACAERGIATLDSNGRQG